MSLKKIILKKIMLLSRIFLSVSCLTTAMVAFAIDTVKVDDFGDSAKKVLVEKITKPLLSQFKDAKQKETDWRIEDRTMATPSNALIADTQVVSQLPNKPIDIKMNKPGLNKAYDLSGQAIKQGLPVEGESSSTALPSKIKLYQNYVGYFDSNGRGNPIKLGGLNIANVLQSDVIAESAIPKDVINLLTDPYPEKITVIPTEASTIAEKESFAQKLTNQALLSVPMNAFSEMVARRVPASGGDNPKSAMQIMRSQCEGRITDPNWPASLVEKSPEALLREIAYMQAFQLYMQYQQYRLNEQAVSLLAVSASAQAKVAPLIAEITKQMNQAKLR